MPWSGASAASAASSRSVSVRTRVQHPGSSPRSTVRSMSIGARVAAALRRRARQRSRTVSSSDPSQNAKQCPSSSSSSLSRDSDGASAAVFLPSAALPRARVACRVCPTVVKRFVASRTVVLLSASFASADGDFGLGGMTESAKRRHILHAGWYPEL